jgi:hypothetical protein
MKSGKGMKSSGGMKSRSTPKVERVGYSPTGKLQVSSPHHMSELHKKAKALPLRLGPKTGVMHLHHTGNRDGTERKHDDSSVIKIDGGDHDYLHDHPEVERLLGPIIGTWTAAHWWATQTGSLDRPDWAQEFRAWVVETLQSQQQRESQKAP